MVASPVPAFVSASETLTYVLRTGDEETGRQWLRLAQTNEDGSLYFEFVAHLHSALLGQNADPTVLVGTIETTSSLAPSAVVLAIGDQRMSVTFAEDAAHVELPDGTATDVPTGAVDALVDHRVPALLALALASDVGREARDSARELRIFLITSILPMGYLLVRDDADGKVFRSSFGEEIHFDDEGVVERISLPAQAYLAERDRDGAPPPSWSGDGTRKEHRRYSPPADASFALEDVTIDGPVVPLGATLTVPRDGSRRPGVVFVSGSGAIDRHGFAGGIDTGVHEIVDGLAERGICGLRYDTPGTGTTKLGDNALDAGFEVRVDEARTALRYLAERSEVDASRLAVIGHSEGALVALVLAAEGAPVPGATVLMAAPGRPLDELMIDQVRWRGKELDLDGHSVEKQVEQVRQFITHVKSGEEWTETDVPAEIYAGLRQRQWMAEVLSRVPTDLAARSRCPILVCQGVADVQVSLERDSRALLAAARASGVPVEAREYADLDHLFKRTKGGRALADYAEERPVSTAVVDDIASWLLEVLDGAGAS